MVRDKIDFSDNLVVFLSFFSEEITELLREEFRLRIEQEVRIFNSNVDG